MADIILLIIVFSLELLLFYFLPTLEGQQTLFGIVLKNDDFQIYGSPILKKYRRDLLIVAFACAGSFFLLNFTKNLNANSLAVAYIIATVLIIFILFKYSKQTWLLRDKRTVSRLATPLKPRRLQDFTKFWLEVAIVILTIVPFAVLTFYYPQLPDVVPVHWNASGTADGFAKKGFFSVFFVPMLAAVLQNFFIILKKDIVQARFRVPAERAEQVLSFKEISLQANVGMVDWCRLNVGVLLGTAALLIISSIFAIDAFLNVLIWLSLLILLAGAGFYLYRMILVNREIKSLTRQITFQTADEMAGWKNGGLVYYNPQDAAFMVEKPGGVGYTINFAHKKTFVYLALILLPELILILGFALTK